MSMLVIGESLIDIFYDSEDRVYAQQPGGSPLNVAIGLSRLGRDVSLLTHIGNDPNGQIIRDYCANEGVELLSGSITDEATSLAHARISPNHSAVYCFDINSDYPHPPKDPVARAKLLENPPQLIHFGSVGAHLSPGHEILKEWLAFFKGISTISYDPNIRLDLCGPKEKLMAQIEEFIPFIDIFKASYPDLTAVYGEIPAAELAQKFLSAGIKICVITYGPDGLEIFTTRHQVRMPAIRVDVVDTVGAGDSLMAALIDGLARMSLLNTEDINNLTNIPRGMLVSLGAFAATAASITVCRQGANPPTRKEVAAQSDLYSVGAL